MIGDTKHTVLELLLEHHPGLLLTEEVIRELTAGSEAFADRDRVAVALRELVAAGLAHRLGAFVFASHAGWRFAGWKQREGVIAVNHRERSRCPTDLYELDCPNGVLGGLKGGDDRCSRSESSQPARPTTTSSRPTAR